MKLWCYLQIMINVQGVEIFIKKDYLLKIIQEWIRFMNEIYLVYVVVLLGMLIGGCIGYSIASYFELKYLDKIRKDLQKIERELKKIE